MTEGRRRECKMIFSPLTSSPFKRSKISSMDAPASWFNHFWRTLPLNISTLDIRFPALEGGYIFKNHGRKISQKLYSKFPPHDTLTSIVSLVHFWTSLWLKEGIIMIVLEKYIVFVAGQNTQTKARFCQKSGGEARITGSGSSNIWIYSNTKWDISPL